MTRPATELLLADELFLLLRDQATGRPRTHPRVAGLGLAAALLGELVLDGRVTVASGPLAVVGPQGRGPAPIQGATITATVAAGLLVVVDRRPPPDPLARNVLGQLVGAPRQRTLRMWLEVLAHGAAHSVGRRMVRAGTATAVENRRLWRTSVEYWPVDPHATSRCETRLRALLSGHAAMTAGDATLLSLVAAVGLAPHVLADPDADPAVLTRLCVGLPTPLRELAAQTGAVVADVPKRAHA